MTPQESNVHPLPSNTIEFVRDPQPVQFVMRVILDNGRDITATVAHYHDERETVDGLLDRTMGTLNRVRAKCEIPDIEDRISQGRKLMAEAEAAIARLNEETVKKIEALKKDHLAQAQKFEAKIAELKTEVRPGHGFEISSPGNKRHLDPFTRRQAEIEIEIEKIGKAMEVEVSNFEATKQKQLEDIAEFERRLEIRKKIVG